MLKIAKANVSPAIPKKLARSNDLVLTLRCVAASLWATLMVKRLPRLQNWQNPVHHDDVLVEMHVMYICI